MSKAALFYEQATPVRAERHAQWCVDMKAGYAFSRRVNAVPLTTVEFLRASREYPIVLAGEGDALFPHVVLGFKDRENLYIDEQGGWSARYIPAFVRRYPFVFSASEDGKTYTLCIDEGFAGCNQDGHGDALFAEEGKPSPYLERMLAFLKAYQTEHQRTRDFCKRLAALDLLEPVQANVSMHSGERMALTGLRVVSREKLKALDDEAVLALVRDDLLESIYAHLASMDCFAAIVDRLAGRADAA